MSRPSAPDGEPCAACSKPTRKNGGRTYNPDHGGWLCNSCMKRLVWRPTNSAAVERDREAARRWKREHLGRPGRPREEAYRSEQDYIDAIQRWAREHGEPPRMADWRPAVGDYPSTSAVEERFGSWNAAIRAAGFTPRPPGRPRVAS